ncbi:composite domain of metallo-dependent hydrolase [Rhizopus microsporus ATCC 52813]|uniref:Composite domain of metallo-dependent hydrolase n=2 Tax=Rhizopus microsporus TaxID=58291 RepID=A0A2G4T3H2_RHIZD|nr:composite domain of metallo-dependent hydrolase [Rhizopus microsporus ATCC 52813]PHZ15571.1 composite domain of metallo-dependent hydrolase [Rhizopus microsporus ATCC 52813]
MLNSYAEINQQSLWNNDNGKVVSPGISFDSFEYGLSKCQFNIERNRVSTNTTRPRHRNPRAAPEAERVLIRNGHIWLKDHYLEGGDIYLENGLIAAVGKNLQVPSDTRIVNAGGRVVTPGIIDMHSHMTVDALDGLSASDDTNEMTDPTTPYVRVIDALNPTDPGIKIVASGGITTSLILPGSGNLMGGEAAVIKLRPVSTLSAQDMLVTSGVSDEDQEVIWRYMKMACGENPKSFYGSSNRMPSTRLGENYLFRRRFEEAQKLKRKQDDWCDAAERIKKMKDDDDKQDLIRLSEGYPEDLSLDSLVALLRHQINLNVHCYLPQDFEAMVHHSLEFDFEIAAFHHALSAWQVPDIIKRAKTNITVATFGDMWGYKAEALNQNVHAPKILDKAGIPVAFKSDHPVMNSRDLVHEAQKAYHYGFNEHKALQALTTVPANSLKLGHRLGSIEVGKDADIVIWERHPLRLGARPRHVFVDGAELDFKKSWTNTLIEEDMQKHFDVKNTSDDEDEASKHLLPGFSDSTMRLEDHGLNNPTSFHDACSKDVNSFVLRNISRIYTNASQILDAEGSGLYLIVDRGVITCLGKNCDRDHIEWPSNSPVFEMGGAVVIPGIVSVGVPLGLLEIQMESSTQDGEAKNDIRDGDLYKKVVRAVDGLKFNGLHLQKAYKAGVTTAISQPLVGSGMLAGVSTAFYTGVENTVLDHLEALVKEEAALSFVIQHTGPLTVSQQIAAIRDLLISNIKKDAFKNVFARAAQGEIPVVVQTDDKDEIASILLIKQQIAKDYEREVNFVILGGAESHLVASHLSRLDVPVILMPARCYPTTWQSRFCLSGPPLTPGTVLDVLLKHKVRVALGSTDVDNGDARNLIWEAGWNLAHNPEYTPQDAVGLITWNVATMFGLKEEGVLSVGGKANFVAYNNNPFEFGTRVLMVNGGGRSGPTCFPKQT